MVGSWMSPEGRADGCAGQGRFSRSLTRSGPQTRARTRAHARERREEGGSGEQAQELSSLLGPSSCLVTSRVERGQGTYFAARFGSTCEGRLFWPRGPWTVLGRAVQRAIIVCSAHPPVRPSRPGRWPRSTENVAMHRAGPKPARGQRQGLPRSPVAGTCSPEAGAWHRVPAGALCSR